MHKLIINDTKSIFNVCNSFDFYALHKQIINNNIDCWNDQNLVYFNKNNDNNNKVYGEYNSYPFCVCIPLYCNKNNNKDLKSVKIVDEIILPNKCQNNFKYYKRNNNNNNFLQAAQKEISNLIKEDYMDKIEDEYLKFAKNDYEIFDNLKFMVISLIDNSAKKNTLYIFFEQFTHLQQIFELIMGFGMSGAFLFSLIYIVIHVTKISKTIYGYKEKFEKNIINFEEQNKNE